MFFKFVLLSNIFILYQINIISGPLKYVDRLEYVKYVKFNTNFLTVQFVSILVNL